MSCIQCGCFCFNFFCKQCKEILKQGEPGIRKIGDFKVYYFYKYDYIKSLILSKHHMHGYFVYKNLAKFSFARFSKNLDFQTKISAVPLDDACLNGSYSHTAILAKYLKSDCIKPIFSAIRAKNRVKYAGKSLEFRQKNTRNFELLKQINTPVILVDDIVTTGTSMLEAREVLSKAGVEVLFGLVLADARD